MNAQPDTARDVPALLTVKQLGLKIGSTDILDDINFELSAGRVLGLIGESGSGKSMTALSIMQLLPEGSEARGEIVLQSEASSTQQSPQDLLKLDEPALCDIRGRRIAMIFQEPMTALNPVKTIGDQVVETIRIHGEQSRDKALAVARETLDRVGLPAAQFPMSRYPHELSGGQRQRVVIAMAIALQPDILIADEPTTALDVTTQAQILQLLVELVAEDSMALLFISHDLAVVSGIADTVAIMRNGKILQQGPVKDIFSPLSHPYTQQLMQASSHVPQREAQDLHAGNAAAQVPLLQVQELVREYVVPGRGWFGRKGVFRAVDRVSFTVSQGESVGLVGESGCGKSTLARAILGLDPLQGGSVVVAGEKVVAGQLMSHSLRRQVQVVFQDPYSSFNPRHKVARLIAEPMHLLPDAGSKSDRLHAVHRVLTDVGLTANDADKYIHEFSGGQRQRIAIARALIIKPSLVILDEAVSALDVSVRAQILDLLAALVDGYRLAYLFISHDLSVVRRVTDRVLVMQAGKIVEQGETEQVFTAPDHHYTQALIKAVPRMNFQGQDFQD